MSINFFSVAKIQSRWKSARDTYMRVKANKRKLKSGSGATKCKKYVFYEMMTFLDVNVSTEADESIDIQTEEHQSTTDDYNISIPTTSTDHSDLERTFNDTVSGTSRKRKCLSSQTDFEKELLEFVKQNSAVNDDEDLNFFKSLLPTVKKLGSFKKLMFRTKVLEALIDIQKDTIVTIEDIPDLDIIESQNSTSTIDLTSLNIRTESQNTNT